MSGPTSSRIPWCVFLLFAAALSTRPAPGAAPQHRFRWQRGDSSIALLADAKTVWEFRYGKDIPKPIFHPLALLDGTVLTWNSPPDHPWHHALWFAWKYLNHVNYWETDPREPRRAGAQPVAGEEPGGLTDWSAVHITARRDSSARIALDLAYHEPDRPPLLREHRVVEISAPDAAGAYSLDWTMTFTAANQDVHLDRTPVPGDKDGVPYGGYAGLSIRLAQDFADARTVTTPESHGVNRRLGMYCESGAVGADVNALFSGHEAGVAFLDYPENLNSPTPWYFVVQPKNPEPFLFAQAAVIYYKPYVLQAGQSFTLRYRMVVHPGRWDSARLAAAQSDYVQQVRKGASQK